MLLTSTHDCPVGHQFCNVLRVCQPVQAVPPRYHASQAPFCCPAHPWCSRCQPASLASLWDCEKAGRHALELVLSPRRGWSRPLSSLTPPSPRNTFLSLPRPCWNKHPPRSTLAELGASLAPRHDAAVSSPPACDAASTPASGGDAVHSGAGCRPSPRPCKRAPGPHTHPCGVFRRRTGGGGGQSRHRTQRGGGGSAAAKRDRNGADRRGVLGALSRARGQRLQLVHLVRHRGEATPS